MITLLVIDDDPVVRSRALRYLARPEISLASAANGKLGLEQALRLKPDVILCDVDMPEMDGFELLTALRADVSFDQTLVLMLTAEKSRDSMRLGMTLGADDYLTKPFTGEELVTAVEALMSRRGRLSLVVNANTRALASDLQRLYENRFDNRSGPSVQKTRAVPTHVEGSQMADAVVLCCELADFTEVAVRLTPDDIVCLMTEFGDRASALMVSVGARHLCFLGSKLLAVFAKAQSAGASDVANGLAAIARDLAQWCNKVFPEQGLTDMKIRSRLYRGDIYMPADEPADETGPQQAVLHREPLREGASPSCASWTIKRGDGVICRLDELEPEDPLEQAHADMAAAPLEIDHAGRGWEATERGLSGTALHLRAVENALVTTCAVKDALESKLISVTSHAFADDDSPIYLAGYRLLRRIGSGGMSSIYVAIRESDDQLLVVKVLEPVGELIAEQMARFSREYLLLSRIHHPNVIRIFSQGFSNNHAYIAMEYFENGDLRSRINGPMAPGAALDIALQVSDALCAIHAQGIVHRDIKPENLMVRADGSVVLADFGIAKTLLAFNAGQALLTQHGGLIGSPSYVSPEQIAGGELTPQSDLYSLGVLLFELLTGHRPYQAQNILTLLAMHTRGATPLLPDSLRDFQSVIDRLMAKQPSTRFKNAEETQFALRELRNTNRF